MSSSALKVGIVGLPNVGKSTLFNALLKKRVALSANYPFATVEPNVGVVAVPDSRLERLAELVALEEAGSGVDPSTALRMNRPPVVPAVVQFVDIAGLVKGAAEGAGLGNQFLSYIREVDAIIHVLRDFTDENVVRAGSENPDADKLTVEVELGLADLQVIDKLIDNLKKEAKAVPNLRNSEKMVPVLEKIRVTLEQGKIPGKYNIEDRELQNWFKNLPLLTIKPVLYVYNVSESAISEQRWNSENEMAICAKLEEELADLSEEERKEYLKSVGLEQTGLERLIVKAYDLLGLASFLTTAGKKEVRAWIIKKGTKAPQAAGVIHSDFEKNFIRAQVIEYKKLIEAGSYAVAKQRGWIRTEGKDYEVKDGDVIEFLVSS